MRACLQVIPVLDVAGGQVVWARGGERHAYRPIVSPLVAGSDPVVIARALLARCPPVPGRGPQLYVADLDALQGRAPGLAMLRGLLAIDPTLMLWLDAGLRSTADAQALKAALGPEGARLRPVYGSESLADAQVLADLAADPLAILSLDSRGQRPLDPAGVWSRPAAWPATLVVMTLDRVGSGDGPDLDTFTRLRARAPGRTWFGAGGVRDGADLHAAAAAGAAGWLVATALHQGHMVPR
jgi:phosphoribosylformimino-5-aminoimidazole carboxamide ribotide isomerase